MDFINSVIEANKEIFSLINHTKCDLKKEISIGAGGDISRVVDIEAEKIFIKYLSRFGKISSEECGIYGDGNDEIIIDPIDGSENFLSNLPYFGTSVSRKRDNKVIEAIIVNFANLDVFIKKDSFFKKAKLNKLIFSNVIKNNYARIGIYERVYASKDIIYKINKLGLKYRSPGAFALSLAYAHDVLFVLFEGKKREYDISAGLFMCNDLYVYNEENILLVSKDQDIYLKVMNELKEIS